MDIAARGIGLYFYLRRRWEVMGWAIYLVVVLLAQHLPEFSFRKPFLMCLCLPVAMLFPYLSGLFANSDQDLLSKRSSYPPHLLTLPVSTRSLALWPMVFGVVIVPLLWLLFASVVLVPVGWGAYLWWPAALLAALVALLQALSWLPLPVPYLRLILLITLLPSLYLLGIVGHLRGWSNGAIGAIYLSIIPVCWVVAIRGLHLARIGAQSDWNGWGGRVRTERVTRHHFTTPLQAQIWLEWKRNGLVAPVVVLFIDLLLIGLFNINNNDLWVPLGIHDISIPMRIGPCVLISLLVTMIVSGSCSPRKADTMRRDMSLQPFLATRPLSCVEIIVAKMVSSGRIVLVTWAVELLFLAVLLLSPAHQGAQATTILAALLPYTPPTLIGIAVIGIVCAVFHCWCNGINHLWIELYGKPWLFSLYTVVVSGGIASLIVLGFSWVPQHLPLVLLWLRWMPDLLAVLCVAKWALTAVIFTRLLRHRLVTVQLLIGVVCVWITTAVVLFLTLRAILPPGYITTLNLVCGITLFLPLARLSLSLLTLNANRHR